jgi:hypothetical protein
LPPALIERLFALMSPIALVMFFALSVNVPPDSQSLLPRFRLKSLCAISFQPELPSLSAVKFISFFDMISFAFVIFFATISE